MTIKRPRINGKRIHEDAIHELCPCCWAPTRGGYCSPEHEALHRRLAG